MKLNHRWWMEIKEFVGFLAVVVMFYILVVLLFGAF